MSKETQYKHEMRNKDIQIAKLAESIKQKVFEKPIKKCEFFAPVQ